MKLYLWREVLCDYTDGVAFAIAESKEQAIRMVGDNWDGCSDNFFDEIVSQEPEVHDGPFGFSLFGGG